jgi:hypothetical protein
MNDVINGILLFYHHPLRDNAPTIMEHVNSFCRCSRFRVWAVNTELGFPRGLQDLRFRIIVFHWSLFGSWPYQFGGPFAEYLAQSRESYKTAFFQDEHRYCQNRFQFLNANDIDCVYTLVEPPCFSDVYQRYTHVPQLFHTLTGYVSDSLIEIARTMTKPESARAIDVGYRARPLAFYMGRGGQEKTEIAERFLCYARGPGLKLDIKTGEQDRIYGQAWYKFLANCRGSLGVESGVSIFDIEDKVRPACDRLIAENPDISFAEVEKRVLEPWEDNIYYRTISPRHFEAAALRVCQILFEGKYSGILQAMVHYIPLKKDFSNFDQVMYLFQDQAVRRDLTDNAYNDLIASGRYDYRRFIEEFDRKLCDSGFRPGIDKALADDVTRRLQKGEWCRQSRVQIKAAVHRPFPGKPLIKRLARPLLEYCRR